jgi:hypothetical protein
VIRKMTVQKFAAGAVFVGAMAAGMFSAAPAFAGPGINYDNGTNGTGNVKFGDTDPGSGATALATSGNQALAISTGLNLSPLPGSTAAALGGSGNSAVAIDGVTIVSGENNHGFSALGGSVVGGKNNNVVTVAGSSLVGGHDNFVVNAGGLVTPNFKSPQGPADAGEISVSVCGTSVSGQAAHITTGSLPTPDALC